jgi:hypothetical protein
VSRKQPASEHNLVLQPTRVQSTETVIRAHSVPVPVNFVASSWAVGSACFLYSRRTSGVEKVNCLCFVKLVQVSIGL